MPDYVEMRTRDDQPVAFEVDEHDGPVPAGRRWDRAVERTAETVEAGVARVRAVAQVVASEMAQLAPQPDRVTIELGLKATAGAELVVARSTAEAHMTVTVEWSPPS